MTNEELAIRIHQGEAELIPELWEQVQRFIIKKANQYYLLYCENSRCEVEDLVQSGYFALLNAVRYHDPEKGFSFLTILGYSLRAEFALVSGVRGKRDALKYSASIDTPVGSDENSDFADFIADASTVGENSVENRALEDLYQQQLHGALCAGMSLLTKRQREVLHARYFEQKRVEETAHIIGCSCSNVTHIEQKALAEMYRTRMESGLNEYLESHTDYYSHTGVKRFKSTHTSSVETIVLKRAELAERWIRKNYQCEVKNGSDEESANLQNPDC